MKRRAALLLVTLAGGLPAAAGAEPLRLRGDALADTSSPTGLLVLQGDDRMRPWLSAEALVWLGAGTGTGTGSDDDTSADALAISVWLRDPGGLGSVRIGRQVLAVGALRPVHADGIDAIGRLPWGTSLEAFGGMPVVPRFGPRAYDWLAGARAGQTLGPARLGLAWMQRRDHGELDTHELGVDGAFVPDGPFDLGASAAWDLVGSGLAEAHVSAAWRTRTLRLEVFATELSPAHLLPATSLFSVLGDVASQRAGGELRWRAAPRLDLWTGGGVARTDDDVGIDANLRAELRLDDVGAGACGLELRREGAVDGGWTGARATLRTPLAYHLTLATELELVRPDQRDRGTLWPWGLVALTWRPARAWEAAAAFEARSSAEDVYRFDAIVRVSRGWELP